MAKNTKKHGVRIQTEAWRKNDTTMYGVKKGAKDGDEKKMEKENFYMRVYDDAVSKKSAIDNAIIE